MALGAGGVGPLAGLFGGGPKAPRLSPEQEERVRKEFKALLASPNRQGGMFQNLDKALRKGVLPPDFQSDEVNVARDKMLRAEKRRRGRRSTILTSGEGVTDKLGLVSRPGARRPGLLGGS
jgi:hypothetical protein